MSTPTYALGNIKLGRGGEVQVKPQLLWAADVHRHALPCVAQGPGLRPARARAVRHLPPGVVRTCIRAYVRRSEAQYNEMRPFSAPEIARVRLEVGAPVDVMA
jgi:hypothetical protein